MAAEAALPSRRCPHGPVATLGPWTMLDRGERRHADMATIYLVVANFEMWGSTGLVRANQRPGI